MEGWRPVKELVRWGFAYAPVVMANEAHNGLTRSIRTREIGVRMIRAAHEAGVRRLAAHLCQLLAAVPGEPLLVWCGNGHASKEKFEQWVPMGWHFRAMSGIDPFVIDQTVTVAFRGEPRPRARELLAALGETLAAHGGTAGILRDQAPEPLNCRTYVDALVVSTDNALTGPPPPPRPEPARGDGR